MNTPSVKSRTNRPFLVTLLAFVVLLLAILNIGKAAVAAGRWSALNALGLSMPTWLLVVTGAVWGAIWLVEAWGLWRLWPPARPAAITLFIVYPIQMLAEQALFVQGPYERGLLPALTVLSALAAALVAFILTRPAILTQFEHPVEEPDSHDR